MHLTKCYDAHDFRIKVSNSFEKIHNQLPFRFIESAEINGNAWEIKKRFPSLPLIVRLHAPGYLVESLKRRYVPLVAKLRFFVGSLRRLKPDPGYWRKYQKENDPDYQFTLLADYITAPSEAMKKWADKNWAVDSARIVVIPNIFNAPEALLKVPVDEYSRSKTVLFFGRLNVLKGLVNASVAMLRILREYSDWKFMIIGDDGEGPDGKSSMRLWMEETLSGVITQVEFLPGLSYESLLVKITQADIVLLPSLFESFSYTCAEAMAAGKAVVGSNNGGMAMLLENNLSGLLVDPENETAIYQAVKRLISSDKERHAMGVHARQKVLSDFNADRITSLYQEYYESIFN